MSIYEDSESKASFYLEIYPEQDPEKLVRGVLFTLTHGVSTQGRV